MPEASFRSTLRRRIAPLAFLLALSFLGFRTCAGEMARVEFQLALGTEIDHIEMIRVDVFPAGESIGVLSLERRAVGLESELKFEAELDPGSYQVRVELVTETGRKRFQRSAIVGDSLTERAVIAIDLSDTADPDQ